MYDLLFSGAACRLDAWWTLVDDVITTGATAYAFIDVFPGCVEHIVPTALARYEEGHS